MNRKRILPVWIAIALLFGLAACQPGSGSTGGSTRPSTAPSASRPTASTPGPTGSTQATQPTQSTQPTQPIPTQPIEPEDGMPKFGLSHLRSQPNGDAMAALYRQVEAACPALQQELPVEGLNLQELTLVLHCYRQDHPESFWLSRQFSYGTLSGQIVSLTLMYEDSDPGSVQFGRELLEDTVQELLSLLTEDMGDYDKARTLYDALIDRCAYIKDALNAHTVYGALIDGEAVCEGYALAYQYLLMRAGIPAMYVTGWSGEAHAWNAMQLDGQWYYADPTWDDPKNNNGAFRYYGYFALTREMMDWDHEADWNNLPLPEATSLDCNYYHRIDRIVTKFDRAQVMKWMSEGDTLRIFVLENPEAYLKQLREQINSMVIEADLPWNGYVYTINGREIIMVFR